MIDLRLPLMVGNDVPLPELQMVIHPPTIKDIAYMGESQFFLAVQYLCLNKEALIQDETLLSSLTNFQVLMKVLEQSQDSEKKKAITQLLKLLFPSYNPAITKNSIILMKSAEDRILIDNNNFDAFQIALKEILCVSNIFQGENIVYKPANKKAQEIANKIMKGRRKIAEQKSKGTKESVLTRYISILTVGIKSLSLNDCINLNLFQLFDLMERYTAFVEWDTDLQVRLAGGNPDKQIESWMRDLHPKN